MLIAIPFWMLPTPVQAHVQTTQTFPANLVVAETLPNDGRGILQPEQNIQKIDESIPKVQPIRKQPVDTNKNSGWSYSNEANGDIQVSMKAKVIAKWGEEYWSAMHYILDHESGSNPKAVNPKSGACGIPQALPCSKLLKIVGTLDNVDGQLDWMINYVAQRYGDPIKAKAFHQTHNWY